MSPVLLAGLVVLVVILIAASLLRSSEDEPSVVPRTPSAAQTAAPPPSVGKRNWLVGVGGEVQNKTFHIGARTITVGRGVSNQIQIQDPNSSRVHCRLTPVQHGVNLRDLGSGNGTRVNGQLITAEVDILLVENDQMSIGEARFVYQGMAHYDFDDALQWKTAGQTSKAATQMGLSLPDMAQKALHESNGDVGRAAAAMGVPLEMFMKILEGRDV